MWYQAQALRELMDSIDAQADTAAKMTQELNNADNLLASLKLWNQHQLFKDGEAVRIKPGMGVAKSPFNHNNVLVFVNYLDDVVVERDTLCKGVVFEEIVDCRCGVFIHDAFVTVLMSSRRLMKCQ